MGAITAMAFPAAIPSDIRTRARKKARLIMVVSVEGAYPQPGEMQAVVGVTASTAFPAAGANRFAATSAATRRRMRLTMVALRAVWWPEIADRRPTAL